MHPEFNPYLRSILAEEHRNRLRRVERLGGFGLERRPPKPRGR